MSVVRHFPTCFLPVLSPKPDEDNLKADRQSESEVYLHPDSEVLAMKQLPIHSEDDVEGCSFVPSNQVHGGKIEGEPLCMTDNSSDSSVFFSEESDSEEKAVSDDFLFHVSSEDLILEQLM